MDYETEIPLGGKMHELESSAHKGDPLAQTVMGCAYETGNGVEKKY